MGGGLHWRLPLLRMAQKKMSERANVYVGHAFLVTLLIYGFSKSVIQCRLYVLLLIMSGDRQDGGAFMQIGECEKMGIKEGDIRDGFVNEYSPRF